MREALCSTALSYAELGWRVLALQGVHDGRCACGRADCSSPGKHPHARYASQGLKNATLDGSAICHWFANGDILNLGVATGAESGLVVLDVDDRHGGSASLGELGSLPRTATVRTGGGQHLYFKWPAGVSDIRNSAGKLGPGLDIRANGGYVVAPPSVHICGSPYKWLIDPRAGLAELPAKIAARLIEPQQTIKSAPVGSVIPIGQRDNMLTSLAGTMRRRGMSEDAILAALCQENKRCEQPLPEKDLVRIAKSIGSRSPAAAQNGSQNESASPARPKYVLMKDVEAEPVHWLWQDRIPAAMLSLLVGIEGSGKTFAALDMAARITTGRPWPDGGSAYEAPETGNVIFLTTEDHLAYTVRPRLDAMGADCARVAALQGVTTAQGDEDTFNVLDHLPALETMIEELGNVRLVIVDPLTGFLGKTDQNANNDVRRALARFSSIAERFGCAILGISHLSKDGSKRAIHRTLGSVAFSASARSVWLVQKDKDNEERRLFVPVKMNIARMPRSLAYTIRDQAVQWESRQFECSADDVLAEPKDETPVGEAEQFLCELLADGRVQSREVMRIAKREHVAERTLRRAKEKLGVVAEKEGMGSGAVWFWRLPDET